MFDEFLLVKMERVLEDGDAAVQMRAEAFAQCARQFRTIVAVDVQRLIFVDFALRSDVFWRRSRSRACLRDTFACFPSEQLVGNY